jgi:septal ring factor EnvC (AmiA/AmiB activator)
MEARVARIETSVSHIETDIADIKIDIREIESTLSSFKDEVHNSFTQIKREFFLALVFVALGLAGMMAKGFNWF